MPRDLLHATDTGLANLARRAFVLGLDHGRTRHAPISGGAIASWLDAMGMDYRAFHRTKLRQVYGAGFDIARTTRKILEQENGTK